MKTHRERVKGNTMNRDEPDRLFFDPAGSESGPVFRFETGADPDSPVRIRTGSPDHITLL
jgi:hypothetical protein